MSIEDIRTLLNEIGLGDAGVTPDSNGYVIQTNIGVFAVANSEVRKETLKAGYRRLVDQWFAPLPVSLERRRGSV